MLVNNDPFDAFGTALQVSLFISVVLVICVVCIRRTKARRRGGYASCGSVGFALQQLQAIARPPIEHHLKDRQREAVDEDDEGGPDDPTLYYRRLREKTDRETVKREKERNDLASLGFDCNNAGGMKLTINGGDRDFNSALTLSSLIAELGMKEDRVAVELNRSIITREHWAQTLLSEGDRLEIVHFVGGG